MIDLIDCKILKRLQSGSRQTIAEISDQIGLSPSACHRRIGLLEKSGVISGYSVELSAEKLGYHMTFYVEVTLDGQSEAVLSAFEAAVQKRPEVLECHLMTGSADYLLKIAAPNTKDYEQIYRAVISALPHVSRIQSALVMKTVKPWQGYVPRTTKLPSDTSMFTGN